jgi:hypothetical protein
MAPPSIPCEKCGQPAAILTTAFTFDTTAASASGETIPRLVATIYHLKCNHCGRAFSVRAQRD